MPREQPIDLRAMSRAPSNLPQSRVCRSPVGRLSVDNDNLRRTDNNTTSCLVGKFFWAGFFDINAGLDMSVCFRRGASLDTHGHIGKARFVMSMFDWLAERSRLKRECHTVGTPCWGDS